MLVWPVQEMRGCQHPNNGDNMFAELQTLINSVVGTFHILNNCVVVVLPVIN